jgi:hypothetical protein
MNPAAPGPPHRVARGPPADQESRSTIMAMP